MGRQDVKAGVVGLTTALRVAEARLVTQSIQFN